MGWFFLGWRYLSDKEHLETPPRSAPPTKGIVHYAGPQIRHVVEKGVSGDTHRKWDSNKDKANVRIFQFEYGVVNTPKVVAAVKRQDYKEARTIQNCRYGNSPSRWHTE